MNYPKCGASVRVEIGPECECPACGRVLEVIYSLFRRWMRIALGVVGGLALAWKSYGWPSSFWNAFVPFMVVKFGAYFTLAVTLFSFILNSFFPPRSLRPKNRQLGGYLGLGAGN